LTTRMGVKVARLRRRQKWSQARLAKEARVSAGYVALIELGQRTPSLATLKKLARALEVDVAELLG
jgi:transcriptional regulator with XRE-family HTH domain